ncbi:MAG: hypothetical protein J6S67_22020 [Methanobrevibacter sp.]|nr:hypothetical protein [Methanobrevibacter sp.]
MPEQFSFVFSDEDAKNLHGIFQRTFKEMLKKYKRIDGESVEDYVELLKFETLMEVADKLVKIAKYRDNLNIELKFEEKGLKNVK